MLRLRAHPQGRASETYRSLPRDSSAWGSHRTFQRESARTSIGAAPPLEDPWLERQDKVCQGLPGRHPAPDLSERPIRPFVQKVGFEPETYGCEATAPTASSPGNVCFNRSRTLGLLVKRLEIGGKAEEQGLFRENDCIVRINNGDLRNVRFEQ
ncbi:hypothetical protein Z043_110374 [Scleropages formosus]|uniref:PDZ domain-containing protein n=1 Tax=Scleropages formosus TaxID=113540 RepID=A0A0P7X8I9_SCLFO|nr:hypothetical protein Z043_110374 [Scleropages formosus]